MDRYQLLRNIIMMAAVDGSFTDEEIGLLSERCALWGFSEEEFASVLDDAFAPDAELTIPPDKEDRVELLQELIRTMAADGQLSEVEKRLFAEAAATMEIPQKELNRIIDELLADDP